MGVTVSVPLLVFLLIVHFAVEEGQPFILHGNVRLGSYRVKEAFITLSGFSSGASFAQQMFVSHSSLIHGIAVFSHTYYRCGPITGRQEDYDNACTTFGRNVSHSQEYDFNNVFRDIHYYSDGGLIDDPVNLYNKPLYVFAGTRNWLFTPEMSLRTVKVFEPYINNKEAIRTVVQEANLTFPTNRPDYPACIAPPNKLSLSNCGFSGALNALQFLLGSDHLRQPSFSFLGIKYLEPLLTFDQTEFFYDTDRGTPVRRPDMDNVGFLYVPRICQSGREECLLHFYFHGCNVGREFVGADHIRNSGFLEVAEANGIIMVFPQAVSSVENDIGCWDTYGFTGPLYATKAGSQVTVVRNMIARILHQDHKKTDHGWVPIVDPGPGDQGALQQPSEPYETIFSWPPLPLFISRFFEQSAQIHKRLELMEKNFK